MRTSQNGCNVPAVKVLSAVVLVALAVGNGCGGRGAEATGITAQRTNVAAAESMLLKQSDLPDGWRVVRAVNPAWFGNCIGVIYAGAPRTDEASTTGETAGTLAEVTSAATVFGSESDASESFRAAAITMEGSQSAGASCVAASLWEIGRSGDLRDVHELSVVAPANVDEAKGWRIGLHLDEVKPLHDTVMDPECPPTSTGL
jgi:hypothetical protein